MALRGGVEAPVAGASASDEAGAGAATAAAERGGGTEGGAGATELATADDVDRAAGSSPLAICQASTARATGFSSCVLFLFFVFCFVQNKRKKNRKRG